MQGHFCKGSFAGILSAQADAGSDQEVIYEGTFENLNLVNESVRKEQHDDRNFVWRRGRSRGSGADDAEGSKAHSPE